MNVTSTIMNNIEQQARGGDLPCAPIKISKTSAFTGIQKGDQLQLIDDQWHKNGDPDDHCIPDDIVQRHPRLFKNKTIEDEKINQMENQTNEQSHSNDNPARY